MFNRLCILLLTTCYAAETASSLSSASDEPYEVLTFSSSGKQGRTKNQWNGGRKPDDVMIFSSSKDNGKYSSAEGPIDVTEEVVTFSSSGLIGKHSDDYLSQSIREVGWETQTFSSEKKVYGTQKPTKDTRVNGMFQDYPVEKILGDADFKTTTFSSRGSNGKVFAQPSVDALTFVPDDDKVFATFTSKGKQGGKQEVPKKEEWDSPTFSSRLGVLEGRIKSFYAQEHFLQPYQNERMIFTSQTSDRKYYPFDLGDVNYIIVIVVIIAVFCFVKEIGELDAEIDEVAKRPQTGNLQTDEIELRTATRQKSGDKGKGDIENQELETEMGDLATARDMGRQATDRQLLGEGPSTNTRG